MARDLVEITELVAQATSRAEELTVNIELSLIPGSVTHAHGSAVAPSRQVVDCAFAQIVFATDSEHYLEIGISPDLGRYRARHPGEEPVRLVGAGGDPERVERKAGVTHPGVAVVPVTLSPDGLRQRGGGCCNDCPGGPVRKRLQHSSAVMNQVPPWSLVPLMHV